MAAPGRVLFCVLGYEPGPVGGAERQARLQAEELTRRGWRVDVVTPRDRGTSSGWIGGVRVHRLPRVSRRPLRTVTYLPMLTMWLLLHVRHYDVVHVHLANLQADVAALACRASGVPLYVKLAAGGARGEIARMRVVSWLTRYIGVRWAARAQATSNEIVSDLRRVGVPDARIVRIPNGLPADVYIRKSAADRRELRAQLDLPVDGLVVLYAGRFANYKGVPDLLEAWRHAGLEASTTLLLVGAPAIDDPVEIQPMPGVIVRPWTANVASYLGASDIYAHPSHADGMPNAVLEAMSAGLAVVATRIAAIPEMIEDDATGLLIGSGAIDELRNAIRRLVSDEALRNKLGTAAADRAAAEYRITAVVDRVERVYRELVADPRQRKSQP